MRILMVTFCPLRPEFGAGQMALNLAAALRERGHDVVCWWPGEPPRGLRWWKHMAWRRRELAAFVLREGPFGVIDAPPVAISARVARLARVVARSIQPELRYLWVESRTSLGYLLQRPVRVVAGLGQAAYAAVQVVLGWHRAQAILCLGSLELDWMRRRFPWLRPKLHVYYDALNEEERKQLAILRTSRQAPNGLGTRFLWIGRWTPHKGTPQLVRFLRGWLPAHPHDAVTIAGFGAGAERDVPKELVDTGRVRLVPSFSRAQLFELLRTHDAGLFTSTVEGWGLSLNEMLESGMPVYATEAGGVPDLRPHAAELLLPFPLPPDRGNARGSAPEGAAGLPDAFTWKAIAVAYEAIAIGLSGDGSHLQAPTR
jgi:glycosyltransferase involved in cell wall biosynthesis